MKVVISAAGKGVRMFPLTKNRPKHLINVGGKPFIAYLLDNVLRAGYKDLILVVGYKAEKFEEFLENYNPPAKKGKKYKYKIQVVNQYEILGKRKTGTACPLMCIKEIVGKENFLMIAGGDFYLTKDLKKFNIDGNYNYIAGFYHKYPERYGVLILDKKGFLKKIVEKPKERIGNIINISLYRFTPEVFEKLGKIKKSPRGEYEITDVVTLLAEEKKVKVKMVRDFWLDFGNPADIIKLSQFLKQRNN